MARVEWRCRVPLLTPTEVSERLRLSPRTVREMVRVGRLPGVFIGRLIRLREEDIRGIEERGHPGLAGTIKRALDVAGENRHSGSDVKVHRDDVLEQHNLETLLQRLKGPNVRP